VPFFEWLRSNSEHYLMEAAQRDMARRVGRPEPFQRKGFMAFIWRSIFTPIYRRLPWGLRRSIIQAMPGSQRQRWAGRAPP
jgi:hypothetical protein